MNENFWILASFVGFIGAVYKPVKHALINILDKRRRKVIHDLEEAAKIRDEAQKMLQVIQQEYSSVKQNADEILHQAQLEAQSIIEEAKAQTSNITKKRTELFLQRLAQKEEKIFHEIKKEAIELALATVEMKFIEELDENAKLSVIDDSVRSLKKLIH